MDEEGLSVPAVVGIVFIILKLAKVVDWKWIWVLSPFWIPLAIVIAIVIVFSVIALIAGTGFITIDKINDIRNSRYKKKKNKVSNTVISEEDLKKRDKERASAITVDYKVVDEE